MAPSKSLDEVNLVAALLCDVTKHHGDVFTPRAQRLTIQKIKNRVLSEGKSFLTKTLPRLGKALDKALAEVQPMNAIELGFKPLPGSKLPMLFGELFTGVLNQDGYVLQNPCVKKVGMLRDLCYLFYKYEIPYNTKQEQAVLLKFKKTEEELTSHCLNISGFARDADTLAGCRRGPCEKVPARLIREARMILSDLFAYFDPTDIVPSHGPGAVATRQQLQEKFLWTNISDRLTRVYPWDAYFCASLGHACDSHTSAVGQVAHTDMSASDLPARVILVPKDSRGPRLISCEPVDFQWIQQGLSRSIVRLVERHPLTSGNVFFTNQQPNQFGALLGSETGRYATLDLNEASDRVSVALVRSIFPGHVYTYLESTRSLATELPDGEQLVLQKFAPMGSALCFPVLALTVWSLLSAGAPNDDVRKRILVYGDDVIVPTEYSGDAMDILESFGLKINRDKSCTKGFFRESCGVDAYKGVNVTPVRIRTVWTHHRSPESFSSWVSYANSFYKKKHFEAYDYIVRHLTELYGWIPGKDRNLSCPSLAEEPDQRVRVRTRVNYKLQKLEYNVWDVVSEPVFRTMNGWSMLLRFFTESQRPKERVKPFSLDRSDIQRQIDDSFIESFSVRQYTKRRHSMLCRRWR